MRSPLVTVSLALCLSSCDPKEEKSAPSGPGPAAASASAQSAPATSSPPPPAVVAAASAVAAPAPNCPPGLTGNATPAYCIKLPAGYSVKEARNAPGRGAVDYDTGTGTDHLTITYDSTPIAELSKQVEGEMKFGGDKLEKKGDLAGGNKWFRGSHAEYARIVTLVQGPTPAVFKCSFADQPKKPPPPLAIEACKTLVMP